MLVCLQAPISWTIAFALLLENAGVPMPGETVLLLVPLFHKVDVVLGAAAAAAAVWLWWKYRQNRGESPPPR